jgi:hypothetical protein
MRVSSVSGIIEVPDSPISHSPHTGRTRTRHSKAIFEARANSVRIATDSFPINLLSYWITDLLESHHFGMSRMVYDSLRCIVEMAITIISLLHRVRFLGVMSVRQYSSLIHKNTTDMASWKITLFRNLTSEVEELHIRVFDTQQIHNKKLFLSNVVLLYHIQEKESNVIPD